MYSPFLFINDDDDDDDDDDDVMFKPDKTPAASFLNKGSKCEGKILAYKKNKPGLSTILYVKNSNEEV